MRLSEVLSAKPVIDFKQIDGFLDKNKLNTGKTKNIDIGYIGKNYYCKNCDDTRTFAYTGKVQCIGINDNLVSIDCVLKCPCCGATVPVWFVVESKNEINSHMPEVRVLKFSNKLNDNVINILMYGIYTELLNSAEIAYTNGLGAGSVIYLRKVYEKILIDTAKSCTPVIALKTSKGKPRPFNELLKEVDGKCHIVPQEFSANGYKLFGEISNIIHGEFIEEDALKNYPSFRRLIIGIIDNINNNAALLSALKSLGW